jgi:hypothetical protein
MGIRFVTQMRLPGKDVGCDHRTAASARPHFEIAQSLTPLWPHPPNTTTQGKKASSSRALFFVYFAFSAAMTVVTSNDIVILTLTPIILVGMPTPTTLHLVAACGVPPTLLRSALHCPAPRPRPPLTPARARAPYQPRPP